MHGAAAAPFPSMAPGTTPWTPSPEQSLRSRLGAPAFPQGTADAPLHCGDCGVAHEVAHRAGVSLRPGRM